MNRLIQSAVAADPNKQQPLPVASVLFIQDAYKEALMNSVINLVGANYSTSQAYILFGCVRSGAADGGSGAGAITAGAIFYNGEIYTVPAASYTLASNAAIGTITVTNGSPDPILLKDGTSANVHNVRQIVFTAGTSGSGTFDYADAATLAKVTSVTSSAGPDTTTGTFAIINAALTYTTPDDGFTRTYLLLYKGQFVNSNGASSSEADLKFRNISDSTDYDTTSVGKANAANADVYTENVVLMDIQSIGPGKTIQAWCKTTATTSSGSLYNSKFILQEIR